MFLSSGIAWIIGQFDQYVRSGLDLFLNSLIESRMSYSRMIGSRIKLDANNLDDPLYIYRL